MKKIIGLTNKITITLEYEGGQDSFSATRTPMTRSDAIDWFEHQVLPALGYSPSITEEVYGSKNG